MTFDIGTSLYSIDVVREIERCAYLEPGLTPDLLMERAGAVVFSVLRDVCDGPCAIAVLCGPGHNGGDGYVLARLAHQAGYRVVVMQFKSVGCADLTQNMQRQCLDLGIAMMPLTGDTDFSGYDVVIDALLGVGIGRDVEGVLTEIIDNINCFSGSVIAIDVPSGLDANTGKARSSAVIADVTVTMIAHKVGLWMADAKFYVGDVQMASLGIPPGCYLQAQPCAQRIDIHAPAQEPNWLWEPRLPDAHKGCYGHVVVVGGAPGMLGAALLAAHTALRMGAGKVTLATHKTHAHVAHGYLPELMVRSVEEGDGFQHWLSCADLVVIGPGLDDEAWSLALWDAVCHVDVQKVVDAGALRLLAKAPFSSNAWLLTPHPGEAASLLNIDVAGVQRDRLAAVKALYEQYGGVAVLKGCATLIADARVWVCPYGNPGMATAGMGDVLSGVLAACIVQGKTLQEAAYLGVTLHALAGDMVAKQHGERGMLASDLLVMLREMINCDQISNEIDA